MAATIDFPLSGPEVLPEVSTNDATFPLNKAAISTWRLLNFPSFVITAHPRSPTIANHFSSGVSELKWALWTSTSIWAALKARGTS